MHGLTKAEIFFAIAITYLNSLPYPMAHVRHSRLLSLKKICNINNLNCYVYLEHVEDQYLLEVVEDENIKSPQ